MSLQSLIPFSPISLRWILSGGLASDFCGNLCSTDKQVGLSLRWLSLYRGVEPSRRSVKPLIDENGWMAACTATATTNADRDPVYWGQKWCRMLHEGLMCVCYYTTARIEVAVNRKVDSSTKIASSIA